MSEGKEIPKEMEGGERKREREKQACNLLSETIYMVVYHSKQSQNVRRRYKRELMRAKRKEKHEEKQVESVLSIHVPFSSLFYSNVV
jgi:IS30 family transposase